MALDSRPRRLGEQVFNIAEAQGEPTKQPHCAVNDLGTELVTPILGLHRLMDTDKQEPDNTSHPLVCRGPSERQACRPPNQRDHSAQPGKMPREGLFLTLTAFTSPSQMTPRGECAF